VENFARAFGIIEITFENIDTPKPDHSGIVQRKLLIGLMVSDLGRNTGRHFSN